MTGSLTGVCSLLELQNCRDTGLEELSGSLVCLRVGFGSKSLLLDTNPKSLLSFGVCSGVLVTDDEKLLFLVNLRSGVKAL